MKVLGFFHISALTYFDIKYLDISLQTQQFESK